MDYSLLVGIDRDASQLVVGIIDFVRQVCGRRQCLIPACLDRDGAAQRTDLTTPGQRNVYGTSHVSKPFEKMSAKPFEKMFAPTGFCSGRSCRRPALWTTLSERQGCRTEASLDFEHFQVWF